MFLEQIGAPIVCHHCHKFMLPLHEQETGIYMNAQCIECKKYMPLVEQQKIQAGKLFSEAAVLVDQKFNQQTQTIRRFKEFFK